jgi:hypothetical protein
MPDPDAQIHPTTASAPGTILDAICRFATCTVSNAIRRFGVRLRHRRISTLHRVRRHADCHGVLSIRLEIAAAIRAKELRIIDLFPSPGFSPERPLDVVKESD